MKKILFLLIPLLCCLAAGCSGPHFYLMPTTQAKPLMITAVEFEREIPAREWKSLVDVACTPSGDIAILDAATHLVHITDRQGIRRHTIGTAGFWRKTFPSPTGIAVASDGTIFVADRKTDNIRVFDRNGSLIRTIGERGDEPGKFNDPAGIHVDGKGNLYVIDRGNRQLQKFNPDGIYLFHIPSGTKEIKGVNLSRASGPVKFTAPPLFNRLVDVTVGNDGTIYLVEETAGVIHAYSRNGAYLFSFGGRGRRPGKFDSPRAITSSPEGLICITDSGKHNVQLFTPEGRFIISIGNKGDNRGQFNQPQGIDITSDGHIMIADRGNRRVQLFSCDLPREKPSAMLDTTLRIAIFDFKNNNAAAETRGYGQTISEMFITAFANRPNFDVIERKQLQGVLDEIFLHQSGVVEADTAKQVGKIIGTDVVLVGGVAVLGNELQIDLRLLDTETGRVIIADGFAAPRESALRDMVEKEVITLEQAYSVRVAPPAPPAGLKISCDETRCHLTWQLNTEPDIREYRVYRSATREEGYELIGTAHKVEWFDSGLPCDTRYFYRCTAVDTAGEESARSRPVEGKTLPLPKAGTIPVAIKSGVKKASFTWKDEEPGIAGYLIYRATSPNGPFEKIGETVSPSFSERGLDDNATLYYRIAKKYRDGLVSEPSPPFNITTEATPEMPSGLHAQSGMARRVKLTWEQPEENDIQHYTISRASSEEGPFKEIETLRCILFAKTSFTDTGLGDNSPYWYTVQATDEHDLKGPEAGPVKAVTKALPAPPRGIAADSNEPRRVPLRWDPNQEGDIKKYEVFMTEDAAGDFRKIGSTAHPRFLHRTLEDHHTYHYRIRAVDRDGLKSAFSATLSATTKPPPSRVTGLSAKSGLVRNVILKWEAVPEKDIDHYEISRRTPSQEKLKKIGTATTLSYHDTECANGTTYRYTVSAVDTDGLMSTASEIAEATTRSRPLRPQGISARILDGLPALSWRNNAEADISHYEIQRDEPRNIFVRTRTISTVPETGFTDDSAKKGKTYRYHVIAVDATALRSDPSEAITITLPETK